MGARGYACPTGRLAGPPAALLAAALVGCTALPAATEPSLSGAGAPEGQVIYLTGAFNGAGLIPIDPLTLEDASARPLLPINPTGSNSSFIVGSLDGSALAVMNYGYGEAPVAPQGLSITVYDARTGAQRARFHPEAPVIVDGLSPDGSRIYGRGWPPRELSAERIVLDATSGKVLEREPAFSWTGEAIRYARDEHRRRLYVVLVPHDPDASAPQPVDLVAWDLRTGTELWRVSPPALLAGRWLAGREVAGRPLYANLTPALAVSPDGRQLAVVESFGCCVPRETLWLVDPESGTVIAERGFERDVTILERIFAPFIAEAKTWDESVSVTASFAASGGLLHVYAQSTKIDDDAEPTRQYLGMTTVRVSDGSVLGSDVKMERGWYENRISWLRSSPDGKWLYVFLERTGEWAQPKGYVLRRVDPVTLRVLSERYFDGYRHAFVLAAP